MSDEIIVDMKTIRLV